MQAFQFDKADRDRFVERKTAEPAKRRPVIQRLGQLDVGQVIPDRQEHRPKHREGRPRGFALRRRIQRRQQRADRLPVDQRHDLAQR